MQISGRLAKILKYEPDKISLKRLLSIEGIGFIKAAKILAVLELVKRLKADSEESIVRAGDIYKLSFNIAKKRQEHFMLITLNGASCVIKKRIIFVGTGDTNPSKDDIESTLKIKKVGELIGIEVLEHLIVSPNGYFSFYKSGLI